MRKQLNNEVLRPPVVFIFHGTRAARSFRTPIFFTLTTIKRQNRDSRVTPVSPINFRATTRPKREIVPQRFVVPSSKIKRGTRMLPLRLILLSLPLVRQRNGQLFSLPNRWTNLKGRRTRRFDGTRENRERRVEKSGKKKKNRSFFLGGNEKYQKGSSNFVTINDRDYINYPSFHLSMRSSTVKMKS